MKGTDHRASVRLAQLIAEARYKRKPDGHGPAGLEPTVLIDAMLLGVLQVSAELEPTPEVEKLREGVLREYEERRTDFEGER